MNPLRVSVYTSVDVTDRYKVERRVEDKFVFVAIIAYDSVGPVIVHGGLTPDELKAVDSHAGLVRASGAESVTITVT